MKLNRIHQIAIYARDLSLGCHGNRAFSSGRDSITQIVVTALCPFSVAVTTEKKKLTS
jgi:hypothetical protein